MTHTDSTSEMLRELREEADQISVPAWAPKLERDTLARGGYSDVRGPSQACRRLVLVTWWVGSAAVPRRKASRPPARPRKRRPLSGA